MASRDHAYLGHSARVSSTVDGKSVRIGSMEKSNVEQLGEYKRAKLYDISNPNSRKIPNTRLPPVMAVKRGQTPLSFFAEGRIQGKCLNCYTILPFPFRKI